MYFLMSVLLLPQNIELYLTHSSPFLQVPSNWAWETSEARNHSEWKLFYALHPPAGWDYMNSTYLPINIPKSPAYTSARATEALVLEQDWDVAEFNKSLGVRPEGPRRPWG